MFLEVAQVPPAPHVRFKTLVFRALCGARTHARYLSIHLIGLEVCTIIFGVRKIPLGLQSGSA